MCGGQPEGSWPEKHKRHKPRRESRSEKIEPSVFGLPLECTGAAYLLTRVCRCKHLMTWVTAADQVSDEILNFFFR